MKKIYLLFMSISLFINCTKKTNGSNSEKSVLSFNFMKSDNPFLENDILGIIEDTIINISVPIYYMDTNKFVPSISHNGKNTIPNRIDVLTDFSKPVTFDVIFEDYSTKNYIVKLKKSDWSLVDDNTPFSLGGHGSVVYDNKIWVIGGYNGNDNSNDVWYSSDGKNWTMATDSAPFDKRHYGLCVVYDGKIWIIGGVGDNGILLTDVWNSNDGKNWTMVTNTAKSGRSCVVYDGKIWITETASNDIWYSNNGINWTKASNTPSVKNELVVLNDKMWIISENRGIWYSENGNDWNQTIERTPFNGHSNFKAVVYDGKIWVTGGSFRSDYHDNVWYSSDGTGWKMLNTETKFSKRDIHTSVVFNNKIWIIGGYNGTKNYKDIWSLDFF